MRMMITVMERQDGEEGEVGGGGGAGCSGVKVDTEEEE